MLKCRDIYQSADWLLNQPTSLGQSLNYRAHLLMCVNCRRYVKQYHMLGQAYSLRTPPLVPEAEMQKLLQSLHAPDHGGSNGH